MRRALFGWRVALRLAAREIWRARARSGLVLALVTLPVVAVVAADVAQATASVSSAESLGRRLGAAQAQVTVLPDVARVLQGADPGGGSFLTEGVRTRPTTWAEVRRSLGPGRPAVPLRTGEVAVRTRLGLLQVDASGVDLRSPLARGLFRLTAGRLPRGPGEVAMNAALAAQGYAVGDTLSLGGGRRVAVVGIAESTALRTTPLLVGPTAWLPAPGTGQPRTWLVGGGPVPWSRVRAANELGATVLSRWVVTHPPSASQVPAGVRALSSGGRSTTLAVLALIAAMTLIEVVLLAGPAFAVGARRQARSLALIAANGGTPAQSRRVVLATAVVIGAGAALGGLGLGIAAGRASEPLLQSLSSTWFGPFQVRWSHVLGVAALGFLSALLAALVPALVASRQDVVAVLAGRRGDRRPGRRSPLLGVALVGAGVLGSALGARRDAGETLIAGSAVLTVLGMVLLVPVAVAGVARLGRALPLPLRYAVRDAARHRTRTVPAVAAVAASVAGTVALSIGNASDLARARETYTPVLPVGAGQVSDVRHHPDWPALRATVTRVAPAARVLPVASISPSGRVSVRPAPRLVFPAFTGQSVVVNAVPGSPALPLLGPYLSSAGLRRADQALASGKAVVLCTRCVLRSRVEILVGRRAFRLPAAYVRVATGTAPAQVVVTHADVRRLGLRTRTTSLLVTGPPLSVAQESGLRQALLATDAGSTLFVERGYQVPGTQQVLLWILFGLAGVLMVGGTLTATFLALSDARADLATLAAVGASPVTRRQVAAAYAVAVAGVGAVLGALVGFVPGIAVSFPLTRSSTGEGATHVLVIPWLTILALVVLLPAVTAAAVGLLARSRLPLVARLA